MTTTDRRPGRTKHGNRIAELLATLDEFCTAQEIFDLLRKDSVRIGLATVYRQLQALVDDNVVDVIRQEDGQSAYRICSAEHHHHLICIQCQRTEEFSDEKLEPLMLAIASQHGFSQVAHELELRGVCNDCKQ